VPALPAGELLGAGSFGRVYRGRWNGADVAVKVIAHEAARAEGVENEVLLMMGLQHECIVAAYYYVTYARTTDAAHALPATASAALGMSSADVSPTKTAAHLPNGNVVNSSGSSFKKDKPARQRAESHLVMEFCDCGTLSDAVQGLLSRQQEQQQQQQQQEEHTVPLQVLLLLQNVARGLQAIHSRHIVHGDLVSSSFCTAAACVALFLVRLSSSYYYVLQHEMQSLFKLSSCVGYPLQNARNVLVRTTPATAAGLTAKLADFGLSRAMKQQQTHRTTKTCGTMSHMVRKGMVHEQESVCARVREAGIASARVTAFLMRSCVDCKTRSCRVCDL
jgi:serine/threonine protein kinase